MKKVQLNTSLSEARQKFGLKAPQAPVHREMEEEPLGDLTLTDLDVYASSLGLKIEVHLVKG